MIVNKNIQTFGKKVTNEIKFSLNNVHKFSNQREDSKIQIIEMEKKYVFILHLKQKLTQLVMIISILILKFIFLVGCWKIKYLYVLLTRTLL